ncbi:hypothetical protein X943_000978 [Babesia divergens]|uniref:Uncharacterized protein n=1 Tax=Babesia divergens TaxID=32595 RepID=A0AAD9GCR2_BABDI|nr:hypothetical protein X943_000978 [Babesia divergens]
MHSCLPDRCRFVHLSGQVTYDATVVKYTNAWQLFISYSGRVGSWICASADTPHSDVYSVRVLLGDRLHEHLGVYVRSLVKRLCDSLRTRAALELDSMLEVLPVSN